MKSFNLTAFISTLFLLVSTNYSQTEHINDVLISEINNSFFHHENWTEKNVFENDGFKNHPNKICKVENFDSTSVIDSVITIKVDGSMAKFTYTYDPNGNMTSYLRESWNDSQ